MNIPLIAKDGLLYSPLSVIQDKALRDFFSSDPLLMWVNDFGEPTTVNWPEPNEEDLFRALFHAREVGILPNVSFVILPNGERFEIK